MPREGLCVVDTAFPTVPWEVVQADAWHAPIYLRRIKDGRFWHHTVESWNFAWENGYLADAAANVVVHARASGTPPQNQEQR